ncbi:NUDIX hydrolase [Halobacterium sp. KA-6]|uniref:NUDIX hydrolase n=1 Tax=Halobacterium sp. KA-6 TaxID=2896368 RepID=UPI001E4BB4C9|nr:NUDIX hydrolase [Halobacterium sp. KA-6]MCD2202159.1 NUDIX hydrolase [Halobacterium sp. KA-6]
MSSSGWDGVRQRLAGLERDYGAFDVVEEETVVPRAVYTDCLQAAEAGSLGGARVVLRHDDEVLLVRYHDHPEAWDFPGGSTERGESHTDTAKFRVHDDVGSTCTLTGVARVIEQSFALVEGGDGVTGLWVFFEGETSDAELSLSEEILEARWFDPADPPDAVGPHVSAILSD